MSGWKRVYSPVRQAWRKNNPEKVAAMLRTPAQKAAKADYQYRLRAAAIQFLGGVCCRCGFDDFRALQIDHINGGGTASRKSIPWSRLYALVLSGCPDYQVLCANCNWIKRAENKEALGRPITHG